MPGSVRCSARTSVWANLSVEATNLHRPSFRDFPIKRFLSLSRRFLFRIQRLVKLKNISFVGLQSPLANRTDFIYTLYPEKAGQHWVPSTMNIISQRNPETKQKLQGKRKEEGEHSILCPACYKPACQLYFFLASDF